MYVALVLTYDGTDFHGYQLQRPELRTVQGDLQEALFQLTGHSVETRASGRTDAGVHARCQIVSCEFPVEIPLDRLPLAINARLPVDMRVIKAVSVPEGFNPRFDAEKKIYRYQVDISKTGDVFQRRTSYHFPFKIDIDEIRQGARMLEGTHDYTSFCSAATPVKDRVRTIYRLAVEESSEHQTLVFWVEGNGFLWNMVRILVGTLLDIGKGRFPASSIPAIIDALDRKRAGHTAPAQGLMLWKVLYGDPIINQSLYGDTR